MTDPINGQTDEALEALRLIVAKGVSRETFMAQGPAVVCQQFERVVAIARAALEKVDNLPSPPRGDTGQQWFPVAEKPEPYRRIIVLWDDGSGGVVMWASPEDDFIEEDGSTREAIDRGNFSVWAYLPESYRLNCEMWTEDAFTFPNAPTPDRPLEGRDAPSQPNGTTPNPPPLPARESEALGTFGHHPDPSTDFCCEVDMLEGWAEDLIAGLNLTVRVVRPRSQWVFWRRLSDALRAVRLNEVVHDAWTPGAIVTLRQLEDRVITGKSPHAQH